MNAGQRALRFQCHGSDMIGIVDVPERPVSRGVLVLADATHYRIGAYRQLTLMTRLFASRGIPAMRFDQRGTGDSEGPAGTIDTLADDIRCAIDEFFRQIPEMEEIVIWGQADAATAAALHAHADARVAGLVLLNPRVDSNGASEHASLRNYYLPRLGELGFWKKVASGNLDFAASAVALKRTLRAAAADTAVTLTQRMLASLTCFDGHVLVLLSGDDERTREFIGLLNRHQLRCRRIDVPAPEQARSNRKWRDDIAQVSANWITSW